MSGTGSKLFLLCSRNRWFRSGAVVSVPLASSCTAGDTPPYASCCASSFLALTRLYTAAVNVNIHPTRSSPRCHSFRSKPMVFIQPKISSTRLRTR